MAKVNKYQPKKTTTSRRLAWVSKRPIWTPDEAGILRFRGFSKGETYVRKIHGPIGVELQRQIENEKENHG